MCMRLTYPDTLQGSLAVFSPLYKNCRFLVGLITPSLNDCSLDNPPSTSRSTYGLQPAVRLGSAAGPDPDRNAHSSGAGCGAPGEPPALRRGRAAAAAPRSCRAAGGARGTPERRARLSSARPGLARSARFAVAEALRGCRSRGLPHNARTSHHAV